MYLILLEGERQQQVLSQWMLWNLSAIGAINNHNLWWANQGPSICTLDLIQNQFSDNQWKIKDNDNMKGVLAQKHYGGNICHVNITKPMIFQFSVHLTSFVGVDDLSLKSCCFRDHLYPTLRPNRWFQSWPPERVSITDDPHCIMWSNWRWLKSVWWLLRC